MRVTFLRSRARGRASTCTLLVACVAIACSASENANSSVRCDSNTLCPSQQVCYREFCIPADGLPRFDPDASVDVTNNVSEPPAREAGSGDASQVGDPVDPPDLDASAADDAANATDQDAQSGPVVPTPPDSEVPTPPAVPPEQGPTTPPVADAGRPASDAGRVVNSSALLICVPSCANRSSSCWFCLNGVLDNNPGICSQALRADPVSSGFCDFLCATAACRGEP